MANEHLLPLVILRSVQRIKAMSGANTKIVDRLSGQQGCDRLLRITNVILKELGQPELAKKFDEATQHPMLRRFYQPFPGGDASQDDAA